MTWDVRIMVMCMLVSGEFYPTCNIFSEATDLCILKLVPFCLFPLKLLRLGYSQQ